MVLVKSKHTDRDHFANIVGCTLHCTLLLLFEATVQVHGTQATRHSLWQREKGTMESLGGNSHCHLARGGPLVVVFRHHSAGQGPRGHANKRRFQQFCAQQLAGGPRSGGSGRRKAPHALWATAYRHSHGRRNRGRERSCLSSVAFHGGRLSVETSSATSSLESSSTAYRLGQRQHFQH